MRHRIRVSHRCSRYFHDTIQSVWFRIRFKTRKTAFTRDRILTFPATAMAILDRSRKSLDVKLKETPALSELTNCSHQAFSKRRALIKPEAFKALHDGAIDICYDAASWKDGQVATSKGLVCVAIDGSKFPLPNLPEYREKATMIGAGGGSPTMLASTAYDINNHLYMDVSIGFDMDERARARAHVERVLHLIGDPSKLLFIFDRGYVSSEMIDFLEEKGVGYIFRCRRKFSVEIDAQKDADGEVVVAGRKVRCARFDIGSASESETEVLATNLRDFAIDELKEFYWGRWRVETSYNTLKNHLEAANFSGTSWIAIQQDFYASAIAADMLMMLAAESDSEIKATRQNKGNIHEYKTNLNHAVGLYADAYIRILCCDSARKRDRMLSELEREMERNPVPVRPGRRTPRTPNGARKVKFHHNQKSNV